MNQQRLQEKTIEKQKLCIQQMQQAIALLEEENHLQKELIGHLQKENEILQKHSADYEAAMRRMLAEFCGEEETA